MISMASQQIRMLRQYKFLRDKRSSLLCRGFSDEVEKSFIALAPDVSERRGC
jgi:hypothetical protein